MTIFAAYVPHHVRWCPAFAACFLAIGAKCAPLPAPHGAYSWLMTWGNETDKFAVAAE